ncbi:LacI family DNA-binding transcriptional regulator [Agromyces sp. ZXT2-3]|uniref:LacI family DNA-binding transcriptional regulator n=1 Tax=Agromyces sp. ZXT2-3 TaxID=3461152 RepID=UPI0040550E17
MRSSEDSGPLPVGMVLARATEFLGEEPYYHEFVAGVERVLLPLGIPVLLHVLPTIEAEIECYERWARDRVVRAVLLVDLGDDDPRIERVRELGLPAVAISDADSGGGLDTVWTNDDAAMREAVAYLVELGHRHLAHVSGPTRMSHSRIRSDSFERECLARDVAAQQVVGDYSEVSGEEATRQLLTSEQPPTAIVFDNDLMALGALTEAGRLGVRVPDELSILAWDDSSLSQLAQPPLSAMSHDVQRVGELAARAVLNVLRGGVPEARDASHATLVERGTTAPI